MSNGWWFYTDEVQLRTPHCPRAHGSERSRFVRSAFSFNAPDVYAGLRPRYRWPVLRAVLGRAP